MRGRLAAGITGALLVSVGLLGGCGGGDDAAETVEPEPSTIQAQESEIGDVLTDGAGMTLYIFTEDQRGQSTCDGDCLEVWPAVEGEPAAGDGVDESLLGSIQRPDGSTQATYDDHPLYYFAEDTAPGDMRGQGVNDVWWVIDPAGVPIEERPTTQPDPDDPEGGGY